MSGIDELSWIDEYLIVGKMSEFYETYGFFEPVKLQMRLLTGSLKGKIMFGNGVSWTCIISLDLSYKKDKEYIFKEMSVQSGIIEILRYLPVSARLSIQRDIRGVEELYSSISGVEVRMERGFVELTSLAVLAGYNFQAKNTTAISVQVHGTLLNENVSTGDDCRWEEVPEALRCYVLGEIRLRFITYSVLARMNTLELGKFFQRMRREVGFQRFYSNLYDGSKVL